MTHEQWLALWLGPDGEPGTTDDAFVSREEMRKVWASIRRQAVDVKGWWAYWALDLGLSNKEACREQLTYGFIASEGQERPDAYAI